MIGVLIACVGVVLVIFGAAIAFSDPRGGPKVGDIYTFSNEGKSEDPTKAPTPFVCIKTILEVKDSLVKVSRRYLEADGKTMSGEGWESKGDLNYATKLK